MKPEIISTIWNKANAKTATLSWIGEKRQAILVKANDKVWIDASRWPIYDEDLDSLPNYSYKLFDNDLWLDVAILNKLFATGFSETKCCAWLQSHLSELTNFNWEPETKADKQLSVVKFYDDELLLVNINGEPFVVMRKLTENMRLAWPPQQLKLGEEKFKSCVTEIVTQLPSDTQRRSVLCMALRKLPAWLYSISPNKVAPHLKAKIEQYQAECDEVLWNHWKHLLGDKNVSSAGNVDVVGNTELMKLVLEVQRQANLDRKEMQTQIVTLQQGMLSMQERNDERLLKMQEQHAQDRKDNNYNWRVMQRSLDRALDLLTLVVQPSSVYLSIVKFIDTYRLNLDSYQSQQLGRQASQLCEAQRLEVGQVVELDVDGRQVTRKGYPLPVLIQACKTVAPNALLSN